MTLRRKYVNSTMVNKQCTQCKKTFPRTEEYFYRKPTSKLGSFSYIAECITCNLERGKKWKQKNKDKKNEVQRKYNESEHGFFMNMWNSIKRSKHGNSFKSFDEFFSCWEKQKKEYGWQCPYYPWITMTTNRGKGKQANTNVSKDRILCDFPYGPKNITFVSWAANNKKSAIDPYLATKYLEIVNNNEFTRKMTNIKTHLDILHNSKKQGKFFDKIVSVVEDIKKDIDQTNESFHKIVKPLLEADLLGFESEEEERKAKEYFGVNTKH